MFEVDFSRERQSRDIFIRIQILVYSGKVLHQPVCLSECKKAMHKYQSRGRRPEGIDIIIRHNRL